MKPTSKILLVCGAFLAAAAVSQAAPASENWENLCQKCHGADGKGQTKSGKKLGLKDYTDAKVQADMKDDEMVKTITNGATDEKTGKERMKAFKDDLSAAEITDLVGFIRKFKS
jgi:cytochrome c553